LSVLRQVDWLQGDRRFPGELRLPGAACLPRAETRLEAAGRSRSETCSFVSSRDPAAAAAAEAVRAHRAIENRLHRVLDVTFGDDQSRLRKRHGARNIATVRHLARNLVRAANDKRSIKSRPKRAAWSPEYLQVILSSSHHNFGSGAWLRAKGP
jgi:predicted transposase YbfD/YdcC